MTSDEYRTAIAALGLSQAEAKRFMGLGNRASRRLAPDEDIPWYVEVLLRIMVTKRIMPAETGVVGEGRLPHAIGILFWLMIQERITPWDIIAIGINQPER